MKIFNEYLEKSVNEARGIIDEPLKEDLETIKKHINSSIFKSYKVKIDTFSMQRAYEESQIFISNSLVDASLGVFGPAIDYVQIHLVVKNIPGKSNSKEIEVLICYTTKYKINNSFPAGKYLLQDGSIRYVSVEENKPIDDVGESKFAVASHEEI